MRLTVRIRPGQTSEFHFATHSRYGAWVGQVKSTSIQDASASASDSIVATLDVIGDRWSLLVLRSVFRGTYRFGELRDELGIASNLLTKRLCRLVEHNVLEKVPYQERPQRFEYRLTDSGRDLSPVLISLMQWGDEHRSDGPVPTVLVHGSCGEPIENVTHCTACHIAVDATDIRKRDA